MRIHRRPAFSLIELLIVIAIIALLIGLTLAAVQRVRMSAARAKCANQLRQIALALHHHHDVHLAFPPGVSNFDGKSPQPFMSWLTRLLPYLEQDALWRQSLAAFDKEKFFENPPHTAILGTRIDLFVCPTDPFTPRPADFDDISAAHTNYLGVSGADLYSRDGILHADSRVTFASITDGPSNTLMVGERGISNPIFGWWYAGWGQAQTGSADSVLGFGSARSIPHFRNANQDHFTFARARPRTPAIPYAFGPITPAGPISPSATPLSASCPTPPTTFSPPWPPAPAAKASSRRDRHRGRKARHPRARVVGQPHGLRIT